jgi:hypothetical protein
MTLELWGTFSVRDHLVPRAFVADVLLYDRLVIPTLPEDEPEEEWPESWDVERQRTLLGDLADLAIAIPWRKWLREEWQRRFDDANPDTRLDARAQINATIEQEVTSARSDLPYLVTRMLLQDYLNAEANDKLFKKLRVTRKVRPGSTLQAVSAYPDFAAFANDTGMTDSVAAEGGPLVPSSVFGWRFFVPESADSGLDADRRLLEKAMILANKSEFLELREFFYGWWSDFAGSGMTVAEGRQDLETRIAEYQKIIKGEGWKNAARYAIKVGDALTGGLGLLSEGVAAGAEAFLGGADLLADARIRRANIAPRLKVAAMFHDARTRFGWIAPPGND